MNRILKFVLPVVFLSLAGGLVASTSVSHRQTDTVTRVVDGDTFHIASTWRGLSLSVRVLGIDTPEHDYKALCPAERQKGIEAMNYAKVVMEQSGNAVSLDIKGWDKYGGRVLATPWVRINGRWVKYEEVMVQAGFARPYNGENKGRYWCNLLSPAANDN